MPRTINVEKEYVEKELKFKSQINNLTNIINHLMKKKQEIIFASIIQNIRNTLLRSNMIKHRTHGQ